MLKRTFLSSQQSSLLAHSKTSRLNARFLAQIAFKDVIPDVKVLEHLSQSTSMPSSEHAKTIESSLSCVNTILARNNTNTFFLDSELSCESLALLKLNSNPKSLSALAKLTSRSETTLPLAFILANAVDSQECRFIVYQLYEKGCIGLAKDSLRADDILRQLVDDGYAAAQYTHALALIQKSPSDPAVLKRAVHLLIKAAQQNHPNANAQLGVMLANGVFFEKDLKRAEGFLTTADELGVVEATFTLGTLFMESDKKKAFDLYLKAANLGLAIAQHNVGSIYFQGDPEVVPRQVWKAIEYWEMSASAGLQISLINLGKLYTTGHGKQAAVNKDECVAKDFDLARLFLDRAVLAQGHLKQEAVDSLARLDAIQKLSLAKKKQQCSIQ